MTPELAALALAGLIQYAHLGVFASQVARSRAGVRYQLSARDEPPPHQGKAARAQRAMANHVETLGLFVIAVVVVTLSDQATPFTATCAWLYVAARLLYIPAYVQGWNVARSLVWGVGFVATLLMILSAFV
jgi:uncharacterized MAPEG superfamily protein